MTTPVFLPQDPSSLATVRYYTQFDPYYYTVDNRPLQDLASNITTIASGGVDSARRAGLLSQLAISDLFRDLYSSGSSSRVSGLSVSLPTGNVIQVSGGSLYSLDYINAGSTTQIIKQYVLVTPQVFNAPAPLTSGFSINYLVQVQEVTLTTANMGTSAIPFLDATNSFLPGLLLNGELKVNLKAGTAASTGTQTTPVADSGWIPLYSVTATYGSTSVVVSYAESSPSYAGMSHTASVGYPLSGAAGVSMVLGIPVFADSVTSGISINVPIQSSSFNPSAPLKVKLIVSSDASSGNAQMQLSYTSLKEGDGNLSIRTSLAMESVLVPSSANTIGTRTLTSTIPTSVFSSFSGGIWAVTTKKLYLNLTRNGSDSADTLVGNLLVHEVILFQ